MREQQLELLKNRRGGARAGAGRPKSSNSKVMRIPEIFLNTVTEIKLGTKRVQPLNSVTEIKDDSAAILAIGALREYFRSEYLMGYDDYAFSVFVENCLKSVTEIKEGDL